MKNHHFLKAVILASIGSGIFVFLGTILSTNHFENYGAATFVTAPILAGVLSSVALNYKEFFSFRKTYLAGFATLVFCYLFLLLFAFEGVICLLMASPIAFLAQWLGTWITYLVIKRIRKPGIYSLALLLVLPIHSMVEPYMAYQYEELQSQTEGIIQAPIDAVWKHLLANNELEPPTNALMKAGISYPERIEWIPETSSQKPQIFCEYSNGSISLQVDSFVPEHMFQFSLPETPPTMKELSFHDEVHAPHLHGNFELIYGRLTLEALPNGHTKVVATSTYTHRIKPAVYWKLWSDFAFDQVHGIIIQHLKNTTES